MIVGKANPLQTESECRVLCFDRNNATCYNWKSCNVRSCKRSWRRHRPRKTRCHLPRVSICGPCVQSRSMWDTMCRAFGASFEEVSFDLSFFLDAFLWQKIGTFGTQEVGHKEHSKVEKLEAQVTFCLIAGACRSQQVKPLNVWIYNIYHMYI